jgi:hypothetical protein
MMTAEEFRSIALSLPEAEERETWGEATFRVRDKIFATLSSDEKTAGVKATLDDQEVLLAAHPEAFSRAHYVGRFGWVSVQLESVDPDLLRELSVDAWRRTAPKRLAASYEEAEATRGNGGDKG